MTPKPAVLPPLARLWTATGTVVRAGFEQSVYSLTDVNMHFQNVARELDRLRIFLAGHGVRVRSAVDVGCGDGAITGRLRAVLGLERIAGIELNPRLAARARARGVEVTVADMEALAVPATYDIVISYGSLHHSPDVRPFVRTLRALTNRYVLIVDNTVRATPLHRITGSAWFPLELSPYPIRSAEDIQAALSDAMTLVGTETHCHANIWHDRSFFLAERS